MNLNVSAIRLQTTDAQVAATYEGEAPARPVQGLIRGFVTESSAAAALIPDYVPVPARSPLTNFLRLEDRDPDQSPTGENAWWAYLNFVAEPVIWDGQWTATYCI